MYRTVEESQTLLINTQSKQLQKKGKPIIRFGFGQSPFLPPKQVIKALQSAVHHKEYTSVQGNLRLRQAISKFYHKHNKLSVLPEHILVAPGSKILLYTILLAFKKADVFISIPSWVSYKPQIALVGHHAIQVKTSFKERWRITPKALNNAFKHKKHKASILIINFPGNPDGLTYSKTELKALAEVAKALNMLVISDEIYGLLNYKQSHYSFANYYPEKTITTTGLSKWCGAGGWRLGIALLYNDIESHFKQALIGIASETYSCAPSPVQIAAIEAYSNYDDMMLYVNKQLQVLRIVGTYCAQQLNKNHIKVHYPQGGFYLFPDFSYYKKKLNNKGIITSVDLCNHILNDVGVALLPASAFGFDNNYLAVRLAYVDFEDPLHKDSFNIEDDCPNIIIGIKLIIQWILQ